MSAAPTQTAQPDDTPSPEKAWPTIGPAPEPDEPGALLVAHVVWGDTGPRAAVLTVLADGRVVIVRPAEGGLVYLLKRELSASGLASVRAALLDVGLFDRDRTRELIKPLRCCGAGDELRVRLGEQVVTVGRLLAYPDNYAPDERWDRFDALVTMLREPNTWLGEDAWSDPEWTPYHAPTFCLALHRTSGARRALDAGALAWPPGVRPFASFGTLLEGTNRRHGFVDAADAYALAASIATGSNAAGIPRGDRYPIRFEEGGTRFYSPSIESGADHWIVGLEPLAPKWQQCTIAWG